MQKHKILVYTILMLAILAVGSFALVTYAPSETEDDMPNTTTYEPYRATLTGETVCLPHRDTRGPQTMECAYGVRLDDGTHYAVDLTLMSQGPMDFQIGKRMTASGVVTPIERLSSDHWRTYDVKGIFSVTDSLSYEGEGAVGEFWGTITGTVLLGPTCPVLRDPPDPECADKPFATRLALTSEDGAKVMKEFTSNEDGTFYVEVPPGNYAIRSAAAANVLPYCASSGTIVVPVNGSAAAVVSCDTGIR